MKSLTRMVVAVGLTAAGVGVLSAGCISSETTPPTEPPPKYPLVDDFCADLAVLLCTDDVVMACYGSDEQSLEQDKEACVAAFRQAYRCRPDDVDYHHEGAEACIAAWQEVYADAAVSAEELADAEETCLEAFHSNLGVEGTACTLDRQCNFADGLTCVIKPGAVEGTCQVLDEVEAGRQCGAINQLCEEGFYCDVDSSHCLERMQPGQPCSSTVLCVDDAPCSAPVDGICTAKLANGEACYQDVECQGGLCNKATGDDQGVCAARIPLYQNGEVCEDFT